MSLSANFEAYSLQNAFVVLFRLGVEEENGLALSCVAGAKRGGGTFFPSSLSLIPYPHPFRRLLRRLDLLYFFGGIHFQNPGKNSEPILIAWFNSGL